MSNYDGSIVLCVFPDTTKLEKSQNTIKNVAKKMGNGFKELGTTISSALDKGDTKTAQLANSLRKATAEVEKQSAKIEELKARFAGLESGEITIKDSGVAKLQKDFDNTNASISKTKSEIESLYTQLDELQSRAFKAPTGEIVLTGREQAEFDRLNAKLDELEPKLETDKKKAIEMGEALKNAVGAATQAEIDKVKSKLAVAAFKLQDLQVKAEATGQKLKTNLNESGTGTSVVSDGLGKMGTKLSRLASGALVFSAITQGFTALRKEIGAVLMSDEEFRQSLNQLQAALWTAFTPIINYIVPVIKTLINWVTAGINAIVRLVATITGKSYSAMVDNAKALKSQSDSYKALSSSGTKAGKAMKKTTDEAKKQLAAFDDLNIITSEQAATGADGGTGAGGATGGTDIFGGVLEPQEYSAKLTGIGMIAGWALVGLGIVLMFSGNLALGIGAIAAGAVIGLGAVEGGKNLGEEEKRKLELIGAVTGAALLGLGVLLLFTKFWTFGLGMIASGAMALFEALALGGFSQDVKSKVTNILLLTGTILLVLGTILLFIPGAEGFGLKMLVAGAMELFAAAVMNAEEIKTWISENCWTLMEKIGEFLFVVGIILLFIPGMMNFGLAAMVAGLAITALAEIAPNWDAIKKTVSDFFEDNWQAIALVSTVLLVLGIILLFAQQYLIGIGLIAAGAVGLWKAIEPNWEEIKKTISDFANDNKETIAAFGAALLVLGIVLLFVPGMWGFGIALIAAGIGSLGFLAKTLDDCELKNKIKTLLNGLITLFESFLNFLTSGIRNFANGAIEVLNTIGDALDLSWSIPTISPIKLPRLATGGIVPYATTAVIGEAGKEAVLPLENNTEWMDILADRIIARNGAGSNTEVILEIDGREFGRAVIEQGNKENRRIGTRLVVT